MSPGQVFRAIAARSWFRLLGRGGAFLEMKTLREDVTIAAAANALTEQLPAGAVVLGTSVRVLEALTGTGVTQIEVGLAADPNQFLTALTTVTKGATKVDHPASAQPIQAAATTDLRVTANGSAWTGGKVRVNIHYYRLVAASE